MSEHKNKKLLEQFTEKSKLDTERSRGRHDEEVKKIEDEFHAKIEAKQRKIVEIEEGLDKVRLERDKFEQEIIINTTLAKENVKTNRSKDNGRAV